MNSTLKNWPIFIHRHCKQNYYVTLILQISTQQFFTVFWGGLIILHKFPDVASRLRLRHHWLWGGRLSQGLAMASFPKKTVSQIPCQIFLGSPLLSPVRCITPRCVTVPSRSGPCMHFSPTRVQQPAAALPKIQQ